MIEQSVTNTFLRALRGPAINPAPCPKGPRAYCSGSHDRGQRDVSHLRQMPKVRKPGGRPTHLIPYTSLLLRDLINSSLTLESRLQLLLRTKAFEFYINLKDVRDRAVHRGRQ